MGLHVARCLFLLLMAPAVAGRCGDVDCSDNFEIKFDANQHNLFYPEPVLPLDCNQRISYAEVNTGAPSVYFPPVSREDITGLELSESTGGAQDQTPMSKQLLLLLLVAATMATMKPMTTMMVMALLAVVLMLAPPVASYIDVDDIHYLLVVSNPDAIQNEGCNTMLHWMVLGSLDQDNKFIPGPSERYEFLGWVTPSPDDADPSRDNRFQVRVYALPHYPSVMAFRFSELRYGREDNHNFNLFSEIEHHRDVMKHPARSFQFGIDKASRP